jgi:hypothetical protein
MHAGIGEMRTCGLRGSRGYHITRDLAQSNERRVGCKPRIVPCMLAKAQSCATTPWLRGSGHIRPGTHSIRTVIRVDIHSPPSKTVIRSQIPQFTKRSMSSQGSKQAFNSQSLDCTASTLKERSSSVGPKGCGIHTQPRDITRGW